MELPAQEVQAEPRTHTPNGFPGAPSSGSTPTQRTTSSGKGWTGSEGVSTPGGLQGFVITPAAWKRQLRLGEAVPCPQGAGLKSSLDPFFCPEQSHSLLLPPSSPAGWAQWLLRAVLKPPRAPCPEHLPTGAQGLHPPLCPGYALHAHEVPTWPHTADRQSQAQEHPRLLPPGG